MWIQDHFRWEGMNWFWKGITSLGNGGWFWIVLCILMVVFAKISGEKCSIKNENCSRAVIGRAGWYGLLSMGAGALITNVCLKNLVARPRPYEVANRQIIHSRRDIPVHRLPVRWCCTGFYRKNTAYLQ